MPGAWREGQPQPARVARAALQRAEMKALPRWRHNSLAWPAEADWSGSWLRCALGTSRCATHGPTAGWEAAVCGERLGPDNIYWRSTYPGGGAVTLPDYPLPRRHTSRRPRCSPTTWACSLCLASPRACPRRMAPSPRPPEVLRIRTGRGLTSASGARHRQGERGRVVAAHRTTPSATRGDGAARLCPVGSSVQSTALRHYHYWGIQRSRRGLAQV